MCSAMFIVLAGADHLICIGGCSWGRLQGPDSRAIPLKCPVESEAGPGLLQQQHCQPVGKAEPFLSLFACGPASLR